MAITKEQLASFEALSEEQINEIISLSAASDTAAAAEAVKTATGSFFGDISSKTGIEFADGADKFETIKKYVGYKADKEKLEKSIAKLKTEIAGKGDDEVLKGQLKDANDRINTLTAKMEADSKKYADDLHSYKVNSAKSAVKSGLKFSDSLDAEIADVYFDNAFVKVMSAYKPEFVNENGTEVLRFRDSEGKLALNPEDGANPFDLKGLLLNNGLKKVLSSEEPGPKGTGTKKTNPAPSGKLSISGVKSQVEADAMIRKHLLEKGVDPTSSSFSDESLKLWSELEVSKLPIQ